MSALLYAVRGEHCWHFWRMDRMYYWIVHAKVQKSFCHQCDSTKIVPHIDNEYFSVYRSTNKFRGV